MIFILKEKLAMISMLIDMVTVDGYYDKNEQWLFDRVIVKLGLGSSDLNMAKTMCPDEVSSIITNMPYDKRKFVAYLLATSIAIDDNVDPCESTLYTLLASSCNLPIGFTYREALTAINNFLENQ